MRVALLVTLSVIVSGTTAFAEDGWVLWEKTRQVYRRKVIAETERQLAPYETRDQCLLGAQQQAPGSELLRPGDPGRDFGGRLVTVNPDGSTRVVRFDKRDPEGPSQWHYYTCRPDSVNPTMLVPRR